MRALLYYSQKAKSAQRYDVTRAARASDEHSGGPFDERMSREGFLGFCLLKGPKDLDPSKKV